jgi:Asp-tRNA(Asn)/Glu-tRNA(Gln) amidotransferase B subunit
VKGKILAEEVRVQLSGDWPDYVFTQNYDLMPIDELETFINKNNHLPEIPSSAKVTEEGGIDVGEMNALLLKKIEELSLYVIELHKEIKTLKNQ